MKRRAHLLKPLRPPALIAGAALAALVALAPAPMLRAETTGKPVEPSPEAADPAARNRALLAELADPANQTWRRTERAILMHWSQSGSASMDLLLERGRLAMQAGDVPAALDHLSALVERAPDFAEGWNARATAYYMSGQFGASVSDIARTLALNPDHFGALAGLGMIWRNLDEPERALEAYRAAHRIHPHHPDIAAAIAAIEAELGGQDI
jgi:tetratricopeptide (TPR) repeat protein